MTPSGRPVQSKALAHLLAIASAVALAVACAIVGAAPASANTIDSFTLSPTAARPGDTVTATATWTATNAENRDISIALPAGLAASWTTAGTAPPRTCFTDSPPTDAACLWNAHASGDTITLTAVLTVAANATPGTYGITASAAPADTNGPLTRQLTVLSGATPAISVAPTSTTPGSTAVATGTFTATTTGDIHVGVFLEGTGGAGTFGTATETTGLTGCVLDGSSRALDCLWSGAVVGQTRRIVVPVNVDAAATGGRTWTVQACANSNTPASACAETSLAITTPTPSSSPSPTATASPSTSSTASSGASVTVEPTASTSTGGVVTDLPTAVPAGDGPLEQSPSRALWILLACVALAVGAAVVLAPRRAGRHR